MNPLWFIFLLLAIDFGPEVSAQLTYSHLAQSSLNNSAWMSRLNSSTLLCDLTLPATHNSLYLYRNSTNPEDDYSTQSLSLTAQLAAGIRAFSFTANLTSQGNLCLFNGTHCTISLAQTFQELVSFLQSYPSETLLIFISTPRHYSQPEFDQKISSYLGKLVDQNLVWNPRSLLFKPTLSETRGKLVLVYDFESSKPHGLKYKNFRTEFSRDNFVLFYKPNFQWKILRSYLDHINSGKADEFYQTHLSEPIGDRVRRRAEITPYTRASVLQSPGNAARVRVGRASESCVAPGANCEPNYSGYLATGCNVVGVNCDIYMVGNNQLVFDYLKSQHGNYTFAGIVWADFPGDALIDLVISINFRAKN